MTIGALDRAATTGSTGTFGPAATKLQQASDYCCAGAELT